VNLDDFDYQLPEQLIAQFPRPSRRDARLLRVDAGDVSFRDLVIGDFPSLLRPGDVLVMNDTRVIPARLFAHKTTGGAVEILIERVLTTQRALAHVRASKAPREGAILSIDGGGQLFVAGRQDDLFILECTADGDLESLMARSGHVPLPPYIDRADESSDLERYQTVYAHVPGAVAAPTAGLHFDQAMLDDIAASGVDLAHLTLHVGSATFRPIRGPLHQHVMHAEQIRLDEDVCRKINHARRSGGRVVAVGTTVARALESAAQHGLPLAPYEGETRLFIRPGFDFQVVDALLTNFHLPRSTLLMLVSTFAGHARVLAAYAHAVAKQYRFFSYGDAMWLERPTAFSDHLHPVANAHGN